MISIVSISSIWLLLLPAHALAYGAAYIAPHSHYTQQALHLIQHTATFKHCCYFAPLVAVNIMTAAGFDVTSLHTITHSRIIMHHASRICTCMRLSHAHCLLLRT